MPGSEAGGSAFTPALAYSVLTPLYDLALEVLGFGLNLMHIIPGGLWELFIGVWLITKGFNVSSPALSQRPTSASTPWLASPEVVGAVA